MGGIMKKNIFLVFALCVFLLPSCSGKKNYIEKTASFLYEDSEPVGNAAPRMMMAKSAAYSTNDAMEMASDSVSMEESSGSSSDIQERKLIKNGNISIQIEDLDSSDKLMENFCSKFSGYISNSYRDEYSCTFTVKVPSARFDEAISYAGQLGLVKSRSMNVQDVSEQYYDLQTRIETKKILQKNLKGYLAKAENLSDILKIERELNSVTSELESMEGRMKRLSNQIDFSTINITLRLPDGKTSPVLHRPSFGENISAFGRSLLKFFAGLLKIILYAVICGIPVIAIISLLFWLLFGKVGLIKKLFNKLK